MHHELIRAFQFETRSSRSSSQPLLSMLIHVHMYNLFASIQAEKIVKIIIIAIIPYNNGLNFSSLNKNILRTTVRIETKHLARHRKRIKTHFMYLTIKWFYNYQILGCCKRIKMKSLSLRKEIVNAKFYSFARNWNFWIWRCKWQSKKFVKWGKYFFSFRETIVKRRKVYCNE